MLVRKVQVILILKAHLKWIHCCQRNWQFKTGLPEIWSHYWSFVLLNRKVGSDFTCLWVFWNNFLKNNNTFLFSFSFFPQLCIETQKLTFYSPCSSFSFPEMEEIRSLFLVFITFILNKSPSVVRCRFK